VVDLPLVCTPHPDGKPFPGSQAFRFTAPVRDLAMLTTHLVRAGHTAIVHLVTTQEQQVSTRLTRKGLYLRKLTVSPCGASRIGDYDQIVTGGAVIERVLRRSGVSEQELAIG
jgi:hypothetical protein